MFKNKTKITALLCGTALVTSGLFAASSAQAAIINGVYQDDSTVTVPVEGTIGAAEVDPEAPIPTFPINPDLMISVELPNELAFGAIKDENVVSAAHTVKNKSSLPVRVAVSNYADKGSTNFDQFVNLGLTTNGYGLGSNVDLLNVSGAQQFMDLSAGSATPTDGAENAALENAGWASNADFSFTGQVESTAFQTAGTVNHELELTFTALTVDGQQPWDGDPANINP